MFSDIYTIDELLTALKDKVSRLENINQLLVKENEKLKSGVWANEEMAYMKKEYEEMKSDWLNGFPISKKEQEKIREFKESQKAGSDKKVFFHYEFEPTGLGTVGTIVCSNGERMVFQEIG